MQFFWGQISLTLDAEGPNSPNPLVRATHSKHVVVVDDTDMQLGLVSGSEGATAKTICSAAIFPIIDKGKVIGAFSLYAREARYFDPDVLDLLDEMTADIAFAIQSFRYKEEYRQAHLSLPEFSSQLTKENNQLRLLLESTAEGIYGEDARGRCIFVSRAGAKMLGYSRDELLGLSMQDLVQRSHKDGNIYAMEISTVDQASETGEASYSKDEVFWRKDGSFFPVEYSTHPINENERISGAVTVFRDITERHVLSQKMNFLATHDHLTKLLYRYAFEKLLQQALEKAGQNRTEYALCYMDLDQFKVVDDTCGHVAGDAMLQLLAQQLRER